MLCAERALIERMSKSDIYECVRDVKDNDRLLYISSQYINNIVKCCVRRQEAVIDALKRLSAENVKMSVSFDRRRLESAWRNARKSDLFNIIYNDDVNGFERYVNDKGNNVICDDMVRVRYSVYGVLGVMYVDKCSILELVLMLGSINILRYVGDNAHLSVVAKCGDRVRVRCIKQLGVMSGRMDVIKLLEGYGFLYNNNNIICECNVCSGVDVVRYVCDCGKLVSGEMMCMLMCGMCCDVLDGWDVVCEQPTLHMMSKYSIPHSLCACCMLCKVVEKERMSALLGDVVCRSICDGDMGFVSELNKISRIDPTSELVMCRGRVCDVDYNTQTSKYALLDYLVDEGCDNVVKLLGLCMDNVGVEYRMRMLHSASAAMYDCGVLYDDVVKDADRCAVELYRCIMLNMHERVVCIMKRVVQLTGASAAQAVLDKLRRMHAFYRATALYSRITKECGLVE